MKPTPPFKSLVVLLVAVICITSCKKNKSVTPPKPPDPVAASVYQAGLAGTWIAMGHGNGGNSATGGTSGDAFFSFQVTVLDDSTILGYDDTLKLQAIDSIEHLVTFKREWHWYYSWYNELLIYNYQNQTIIDTFSAIYGSSSGSSSKSFQISATKSHIDRNSIGAIAAIAGDKLLSGPGSDSFMMRVPPDSFYTRSDTLHFYLVDDSTLSFSPNILDGSNAVLHFKAKDALRKTVTLESFHIPGSAYRNTIVTYNYETDAIVFEQEYRFYGKKQYVRLTN
ncbi:MAG: hypothetical protein V4649_00200 [Bacteroidota bacterium]